jgi:hypothetical protein
MSEDDVLLSTLEAQRLCGGVSRMWFHRRRKGDPDFPKPVQFALNGPLFYWRSELLQYIECHRRIRPQIDDLAGRKGIAPQSTDAEVNHDR